MRPPLTEKAYLIIVASVIVCVVFGEPASGCRALQLVGLSRDEMLSA